MNINLYISILVGISLVFYLLYPADSTYGSMAINTIMSHDLSASQILTYIATTFMAIWPILAGIGLLSGIMLTTFGASSIIPIVWNLMIFFVIPNLFLLPTHLILSGTSGLPTEVGVVIIFLLNSLLLLTAIEFWK